jgi:chromosome segregation ATPase
MLISILERLGDVEKRLGATNTDFETAKAQARQAVEDFKQTREKRCRKFMKAFDHISKNIDVIYKELTGGAGAAYLTCKSQGEGNEEVIGRGKASGKAGALFILCSREFGRALFTRCDL